MLVEKVLIDQTCQKFHGQDAIHQSLTLRGVAFTSLD